MTPTIGTDAEEDAAVHRVRKLYLQLEYEIGEWPFVPQQPAFAGRLLGPQQDPVLDPPLAREMERRMVEGIDK